MKKTHLITGILYTLAGIAFLAAALVTQTRWDGILFGFAGAGIGPGLAMIVKYAYWSSPNRREAYAQKLEHERIEMNDELKTALRDKSGRYAYLLGLFVLCGAMLLFSVLGTLDMVAQPRLIVLTLAGLLFIQLAAGVLFFNRLLRQYN